MKPLLGTLYLLRMLVPGGLGYARSLAHRQEVVNKTITPWRSLETYPYNRYHPMGEWMSQISEKYAKIVTKHFLGMTYEMQPMYYLKISQPSNNPKIIWMDYGIHARERIAPAFCQWFVKEILQNYQGNPRVKFLKNLDIYVLPVLNIDGYIYTWTIVRFWRKSRSSHNNGTCFGTDLTRDFNASRCSIGAPKHCQGLTCGAGPASEPETRAVSSLVESKKKDLLCYLTIHSYVILIPYSYTKNKASNHDELIRPEHQALDPKV
ncbi:LOW QUALITY PROTEIN: carboxypeptidase O [Molossus nigricans]